MSKKFYPIEPLNDGCVLGKNAYWYVRMYWKDRGESEQPRYLSYPPRPIAESRTVTLSIP